MGRKWSKDEEGFIRKNAGMGAAWVSVRLGRSVQSVSTRASILGVNMGLRAKPNDVFTDPDAFRRRTHLDGGCWLWSGAKSSTGYGEIVRKAKRYRAHRVSWRLHHGEIPDGLLVCHKCDRPLCVNPDHLFLGTHRDNMIDKARKGRGNFPEGSRHYKASVTEGDARAIKKMSSSGVPMREIAKRFGTTENVVSLIHRGKTWKSVNGTVRKPGESEMREQASKIIEKVAYKNDLTPKEMIFGSRERRYCRPRQEAMFEIYVNCPHVSYTQMAKMLNLKDHTTCWHGVKAHAERSGMTYEQAKAMRMDRITEIAVTSPNRYAVVAGGSSFTVAYEDVIAFFAPKYERVMRGEAA